MVQGQSPCPHEIQINLGASYSIGGFTYLPRQDGSQNGMVGQWQFYTSTDGKSWGNPVATGTWTASTAQKEALFPSVTGQYIRFRALTEVNGNPWTSAAEIGVLGQPATTSTLPSGTIVTPTSDVQIAVGGTVDFTGSGTSSTGNLPLTYLWTFGSGSGIANSTLQNPGNVQFNTPGTYVVTFTVTDSKGNVDPAPPTRTITVAPRPSPRQAGACCMSTARRPWERMHRRSMPSTTTPATYWHTQWYAANPPCPHEIEINLGASYSIGGFTYLPRQDGGQNGMVGQWQLYVSSDGRPWGNPVATGTWTAGTAQKQALFPSVTGRYIQFRALTEVNGNPWTSAAEIGVLGQPAATNLPSGTITSPTGNVQITVGGTVDFTGTGTSPTGNLPLTYLWTFGSGSGIANSTVQNPGNVQFNTPGTYVVTFTVTDSQGNVDPGPPTRTITVVPPAISKTGWSLLYVDSQETVGENAPAVDAFDNNSATYWHTQWYAANPPCPHEIEINLGASYSIGGFTYLPRQDGSQNGMVGQWQFYVSTDGQNWGNPVATGTWTAGTAQEQVIFTPVTGQYIQFRALTEVNGKPWTSAAEIGVLGTTP